MDNSTVPMPVPIQQQQQSASISTAIHYANVAHSITNPSLRLKYLTRLRKFNEEKNYPAPVSGGTAAAPDIQTCSSCSLNLIAGLNVEIRIVYMKKKTSKKKHRERVLRYRCLSCGFNNDYKSILKQPDPDLEPQPESEKLTTPEAKGVILPSLAKNEPSENQFKAEWKQQKSTEASNTNNTNAKKRSAKRKKMNNLSMLLQEKNKKNSNGSNKLPSLDLMDFMK